MVYELEFDGPLELDLHHNLETGVRLQLRLVPIPLIQVEEQDVLIPEVIPYPTVNTFEAQVG